ncbi:hypothetical protein EC900091_6019, partial [Escherichia coli 90.0091]
MKCKSVSKKSPRYILRISRASHNTEPFRMTLEDTGLAVGA